MTGCNLSAIASCITVILLFQITLTCLALIQSYDLYFIDLSISNTLKYQHLNFITSANQISKNLNG